MRNFIMGGKKKSKNRLYISPSFFSCVRFSSMTAFMRDLKLASDIYKILPIQLQIPSIAKNLAIGNINSARIAHRAARKSHFTDFLYVSRVYSELCHANTINKSVHIKVDDALNGT